MVDKRPEGQEYINAGGRAELAPPRGEVRKPRLTEVVALKALIDGAQGAVLSRELRELYENVRDFYVYADGSGLGGCVALHIDMIDLAEVRTLVVRPDLQRKGIGRRLLEAVLTEARSLEIARVYAFTREPAFFANNGFRIVDRSELPYKVFKDCTRCRLFPGCDETAMMRDLRPASGTENQGG